MTIPVWVEQQNGRFTATVLGAPQLRADGATKDDAVATLLGEMQARQSDGQLLFVHVPPVLPQRSYTQEEIELLRELTAEAYRYRDELKRQEFPE